MSVPDMRRHQEDADENSMQKRELSECHLADWRKFRLAFGLEAGPHCCSPRWLLHLRRLPKSRHRPKPTYDCR